MLARTVDDGRCTLRTTMVTVSLFTVRGVEPAMKRVLGLALGFQVHRITLEYTNLQIRALVL